ncbi:MAG: glycosyltransferase family 4 protein [Cyanobacteria bacterium J06634_6]
MTPWIVCQLGAREHYAIPRALHRAGQLHKLVTDAWVAPNSAVSRVPGLRSLGDRHHPELTAAPIKAFTPSLIQFEAIHRLQKTGPWERMIARNNWFQKQTISYLRSVSIPQNSSATLFSYSYAALELFQYAKQRGWHTVLGQIDPGILEEKIVIEEHKKNPRLAPDWRPVPSDYWQRWQQECDLANEIIVNSGWSKQLLEKADIDPDKIKVVPLVYTPPAAAQRFQRHYPEAFSQDRPLRVLFLGLVGLRKGIAALLEAVQQLENKPIEFWMVGPQDIRIPPHLLHHPKIRWIGPVPRSQVQNYYREADVFLFPTLSDGFGLTQLEAQAWKLPLITSNYCGDVAQDGINGLKLSEVNADQIAKALTTCLQKNEALQSFSKHSYSSNIFDVTRLEKELLSI